MEAGRIPSSDLTPEELRSGYWIATHRQQLRKVSIAVLSLLAAMSVGVFLWMTVQWILRLSSTERIEQSLWTDTVLFSQRQKPQPLQNVRSYALRRDASHVDVVVQITNSNMTWGAYRHVVEVLVGGQSAGAATVSLAPGQTWYVTRMNVPWTDSTLPRVELVVHESEWRRMSDVRAVVNDTWEYNDVSFAYVDAVVGDAVFASELLFTVRNTSVVGFIEPEVVVLLQDDGGNVVAVGSIILSKIDSLERRPLRFLWPERYPRSLQPVIYMNVDKINKERIISPTTDNSS